MFKKVSCFALVLVAVFLALAPVQAAEFKSGNLVNITDGKVDGDLFAASNYVNVSSSLPGDAFLAGNTVQLAGSVAQSVVAAGSMVNISGKVGHALRVAGSQVTISGTIEGDVMAAGGTVNILPSAVIKGDLYLGSGNSLIQGEVQGKILAAGGNVILDGKVGKDAYIQAEELTLASTAKIGGKLTYKSSKEASFDKAQAAGGVEYIKTEVKQSRKGKSAFPLVAAIGWFLVSTILSLVAAFVGFHFLRKRTVEVVSAVMPRFMVNLGWGFVWLVMVPIACVILAVTLLGIPFALFGMIVYSLVSCLAKVLSGILLGVWILHLFNKKRGWVVDWKAILLGVIVINLLLFIPLVGWLLAFIFFLPALGGIVLAFRPVFK
ncbi:MAG: polymer-forming cytoskeletal protein [Patescibacteria group bacterium]